MTGALGPGLVFLFAIVSVFAACAVAGVVILALGCRRRPGRGLALVARSALVFFVGGGTGALITYALFSGVNVGQFLVILALGLMVLAPVYAPLVALALTSPGERT